MQLDKLTGLTTTKGTSAVAPRTEAQVQEIQDFAKDFVLPGGKVKFDPMDDLTIIALAAATRVEETFIRNWVSSIYLKGVDAGTKLIVGATQLIKLQDQQSSEG